MKISVDRYMFMWYHVSIKEREAKTMTKTVQIEWMDKSVTIETDELRPYTAGDDTYEETAIASDGTLVAYDNASNMWVQLWTCRPEDYPVMTRAQTITENLNYRDTWDYNLLEELCKLAEMEKEWDAADGDNFESVAYAAAEKLGVKI